MKILLSLVLAAVAFVFSSRAGSFDLASLPDFQGVHYNVNPYITAAAHLQEMGRESACKTLLQAAQTNQESRQIVVLCRMLFVRRDTREFRRPMIGGVVFCAGTDYSDWPLEPIELVHGVPFLITQGYILAGVAEPADD